jgi:hypothetical protein
LPPASRGLGRRSVASIRWRLKRPEQRVQYPLL